MQPRFFCFLESPHPLTRGRRNHKKKEKGPGRRNSSNRPNLKGNSKPRRQDSSASSKLRPRGSSVSMSKLRPRDSNVNSSKPRGNGNSVNSRLDLLNLPSVHSGNRIDNVRSPRCASAPGAAAEFQTIVSVLILAVSTSSELANHGWLADILGSSMGAIGLDSLNRGR